MGKHDKHIVTSTEEFLMATAEKLRNENATLKATIRAMERDAARQDRAYDRVTDRDAEVIAEKDATIARLEKKIADLYSTMGRMAEARYVGRE